MVKIYIVIGSVGVYEDFREWNVVAYQDSHTAAVHRDLAQKFSDDFIYRNEEKSPYDTGFRTDLGDAPSYRVEELELLREVPLV